MPKTVLSRGEELALNLHGIVAQAQTTLTVVGQVAAINAWGDAVSKVLGEDAWSLKPADTWGRGVLCQLAEFATSAARAKALDEGKESDLEELRPTEWALPTMDTTIVQTWTMREAKGLTRHQPADSVRAVVVGMGGSADDRNFFRSGPNEWTFRLSRVLTDADRAQIATKLRTAYMLARVCGETRILSTGGGLEQFKTDAWTKRHGVVGAHRDLWRLEVSAVLKELGLETPPEMDGKWGFDLHTTQKQKAGVRILYGLGDDVLTALTGSSFRSPVTGRPLRFGRVWRLLDGADPDA
eukprot:TRINITY_DN18771_c1_g1_i1.p1 TRINITY_DN18771_c1_g1~~TRINITY_DN18771_c1_g1_i1.p1  ORF type:complete len:297 (-),score=49.18 TRINITY_DN18771_c1_g1_i1:295-1185(-)